MRSLGLFEKNKQKMKVWIYETLLFHFNFRPQWTEVKQYWVTNMLVFSRDLLKENTE